MCRQVARGGRLTGASDGISEAMLRQPIVKTLSRNTEQARGEGLISAGVGQRPYDVIAFDFLQRAEDDRSFCLNGVLAVRRKCYRRFG